MLFIGQFSEVENLISLELYFTEGFLNVSVFICQNTQDRGQKKD